MSFSTEVRRLKREFRREDSVRFITVIGSPSFGKLGVAMASPREALVEGVHYVAHDDESVEAFHDRLRTMFRTPGKAVTIVLGSRANAVAYAKAKATWAAGDQPLYPDSPDESSR